MKVLSPFGPRIAILKIPSNLLEKLNHEVQLLKQKSSLFTGEIENLRSLLKTYDAEFKIGKPEESTILKLKVNPITY